MDRRRFLSTLGLGVLGAPLVAEPQQAGKVPRIGYLSPASAETPGHAIFRQRMRELGYVEG